MQIEQEPFEAWLFSQPPQRKFAYWKSSAKATTGCLLCNFLRETVKTPHTRIGTASFAMEGQMGSCDIEFPEWLKKLLSRMTTPSVFTAGDKQKQYLLLFPETNLNTQNVQTEPTPAA